MQRYFAGIWSGLGMLILILDSQTALIGAKEGLRLVLETVIPSLFPFFFLSIWLVGSADSTCFPVLKGAGRLFRIPKGTESLLIPAFLGGYPTGAQAVASAWQQGRISKETAERLLTFCSNAGPSFLFGMLPFCFPDRWTIPVLCGIHILGALYAARMIPAASEEVGIPEKLQKKTLSEVLTAAIKVTALVSGWIILFRILLAFLDRWILWCLPGTLQVLLSGLLEMTNGLLRLEQLGDLRIRFVVCSLLLSLGGLCITLQTRSVTRGLTMKYYYHGKLLQAFFSACLSFSIAFGNILPALVPMVIFLIRMGKNKKTGSIPAAVGV